MSCPRCRKLFVVCAMALWAFHPAAYAAGSPDKPSDQQVARWIKELGDDNFAVREQASRQLWLAGEAAEPAFEKALQSSDPEVVRRARSLLDKFRWGIYPDTPAEVVALIQAYQSSGRRQDLEKLLNGGPAALRAVLKFAENEKDSGAREALRNETTRRLVGTYQRLEPSDADRERFEVFLNFAYQRDCIPHNHYVAYWLLRGRLDEQIASLRACLSAKPDQRRIAETLAYLYRAKGNSSKAREAAAAAKQDNLLQNLLVEEGQWKALSARPDAIEKVFGSAKWTYCAAFARLAGQGEDFENAVRELLQTVEKNPHYATTLQAARVLLLNDRPRQALALLAKSPDHQTELFELLCARRQYREALALADQVHPANRHESPDLSLLKTRTLYQLGEKDRARAFFVRYGEQIKDGVKGNWAARLLEQEYGVGLKDLAFEHCARLKSVKVNWGDVTPGWGEDVFLRQVFPERSDTAKIWWDMLWQRFPSDSAQTVLKRLRHLLEGKTETRILRQWIEEVERGKLRARLQPGEVPDSPPPLRAGDPHWPALADAALANGLDELAASLLEKADTPESLLRLGDVLAQKKEWLKAADRYRQAWQKSLDKKVPYPLEAHGNPLPLYLAGYALARTGQKAAGDKLIKKSHQALLGDVEGRQAFLCALEERGHVQAARREVDLLSRLSEPNSSSSGAVLRRQGRAAANRKDYHKAADCYQQSMLRCLPWFTYYNQIGSYASVPALVHRFRAAALLADGKYDEADGHIELALELSPGNVDLAAALVPALERCGRKKQANALFERCLAPHEKTCRDYPRCDASHNSAAWLSACCRRNLDKALEHANKAVELRPTNAGYLDTLAEVYFQRGDKDKAIIALKRAIDLDPKQVYYRKQLKRLQAGDRAAERPSENEE